MRTEILCIETSADFASAAERAADFLKRGEVVALPTETVYGLAANALNESAVRRIYEVKGRPHANPIIVHVSSLKMARECTVAWPEAAASLAAAFWPGPLTLVLPRASRLPAIVSAGGDTVGLRWPAHPFMHEVIRRCGFPLAAPSANISNALSPTSAGHVLATLAGRIPLIIDAGSASVGIESTVLDLTSEPPRILRAGMIDSSRIAQILRREVLDGAGQGSVLKSPGLLRKHYAPRARLIIQKWRDDGELRSALKQFGIPLAEVSLIAYDHIPNAALVGRIAVIPNDPEAYARALYAELHRCDELGARLILVEEPPSGSEWAGIRDRLQRASATD